MGKINVRIGNKSDLEVWDSIIDKNVGGTIFHKIKWLKITEKHTNSKLLPLVITNGHSTVSQFPVFLSKRSGMTFALSPPAGGLMPYLGPVFCIKNKKQSSIESIMKGVIEESLNFIQDNVGRRTNFFRIILKDCMDMRPFIWNGFDANPLYTYKINIGNDNEQIMNSFSQSTRRYLKRNLVNEKLEVSVGNIEDAIEINKLVSERYAEQGISYGLPEQYLIEIYEEFNNVIDVFILKENGEFKTGLITLKVDNSIGHWIGATQTSTKAKETATLLHWHAIQKGKNDGMSNYDLFGANTEKLCLHKSKLNPDLELYFSLTKEDFIGKLSRKFHKKFRGK